jgi:transketolase
VAKKHLSPKKTHKHMDSQQLTQLAKLIRIWILEMTHQAGSGHVTSSLSAVELMNSLMFGGQFTFDLEKPNSLHNDKLLFSKGHAAPLLYALWAAAGAIEPEELLTLRQLNSRLQGHPTMNFPFTLTPTGSLGQGLGIATGIAYYHARINPSPAKMYVLLGDSEFSEGSNWEALTWAAHHQLNNLVVIVDVNGLGQQTPSLLGLGVDQYAQAVAALGWETYVIDGHDLSEIEATYKMVSQKPTKPSIIFAQTIKGKGVSFLENQVEWHGKALNEEQLSLALQELGEVDRSVRGLITKPTTTNLSVASKSNTPIKLSLYTPETEVEIREAVGQTLVSLVESNPTIMVLDAEMSNSTKTGMVKQTHPEKFLELYIAEQNMVSVGLGLATQGVTPIMGTFGAFWSRAHDQLRMAAYANQHLVCIGSHVGVAIGQDGASQMGLEDIALFRTLYTSAVLYPSDAVSAQKLLVESVNHKQGIIYVRSSKNVLPVLYDENESFVVGGSKTLKASDHDQVTLIGAGVTLHECLKAHKQLKTQGITTRVIDLYSIKPLDVETLVAACKETKALIVVEDHFAEGGIAEAVRSVLVYETTPIHSLCVRKIPQSGRPEELLEYEGIDSDELIGFIRKI